MVLTPSSTRKQEMYEIIQIKTLRFPFVITKRRKVIVEAL